MLSATSVIPRSRRDMMRRRIKIPRRRIICKRSYHQRMHDRQLLLKTATTYGFVAQLVEHNLRAVGLPAFLLPTLTHIRDREPVSPSEISVAAGVPMTTLRDNVQRLVDRRLVRRTPNPADGRSPLLRLTARGRAVAEAAGAALLDT